MAAPVAVMKGDDLDPAQDACLKTKCGSTKLFCLCLPDKQMKEYKAQLQANDFVLDDRPPALPDREQASMEPLEQHPLLRLLELRLWQHSAAEKPLRQLRQLAKAGKLGELETESLGAAVKFIDILCPFHLKDLDLPVTEQHPSMPLEYGKRIRDGFVEWFSVGDYEGCDFVKAVATYLEVDLAGKFYSDLTFAKELGESSATGTVWHIATRNRSGQQDIREDNIYQYRAVNALRDDKVMSVLVFVWTFQGEVTCDRPKPMSGCFRVGFECTIYRFLPHFDPSTKSCNGFRLARANISAPPPSLYAVAFNIDAASMRESARIGNENFYTKFREHLNGKSHPDLVNRRDKEPRCAFYIEVKRHLQGGPPKATVLQRLGRLCCCACHRS